MGEKAFVLGIIERAAQREAVRSVTAEAVGLISIRPAIMTRRLICAQKVCERCC